MKFKDAIKKIHETEMMLLNYIVYGKLPQNKTKKTNNEKTNIFRSTAMFVKSIIF